VGGDFYHLFRLSGGRLGVMIGDVSSHGFAAALIMALTMSAVAIHASEGIRRPRCSGVSTVR
jgi:phosphoserine phosphatase RsbU/P